MDRRKALIEKHGIVRTSELLAMADESDWLRIARNYGALVQVRQGWWALPGTPEILLVAWRAGGRLACLSALVYHGETLDVDDTVHIEVAAGSKGARSGDVVTHWSRDQGNGDRRAVSVEVALRQASRCSAANGTL